MNILAILGAVLIGLSLGLLGSGGSIITVPLLIYVLEEPAKLAIAESLLIVGCISTFSGAGYIKRGLVNWQFVMLFGLPSMFGTYFGAWISQYVSGLLQLITFSIVMLVASRAMFSPVKQGGVEAMPPRNLLIIGVGILVGLLAGFVGVGGGFLIVPALFLLGKLAIQNAIGTSLIIIAMQSFTGFFKYQMVLEQFNLAVNWKIVLVMIVVGIAGSILGIRIADKMPQQKIRKLFGYALIILGTYILLTSIYQLFY
jgi:uncharacterized membrane protein YfcA